MGCNPRMLVAISEQGSCNAKDKGCNIRARVFKLQGYELQKQELELKYQVLKQE